MKGWDDVVAFALTLPGAELSSSYGKPAVKVRGKSFVTTGREADSFHVMSPHEEKAVLIETDPSTFWQTAHYEGWPGLLVHFGSNDPERVERVITRAWWDRGSKAEREAFGDRP
jgi:hypothetical protein